MLTTIELSLQTFPDGCRRAQVEGLQRDSPGARQAFIRHLTGNHKGYEAMLHPLLDTTSSPNQLLYDQCQLALKAPKVVLEL